MKKSPKAGPLGEVAGAGALPHSAQVTRESAGVLHAPRERGTGRYGTATAKGMTCRHQGGNTHSPGRTQAGFAISPALPGRGRTQCWIRDLEVRACAGRVLGGAEGRRARLAVHDVPAGLMPTQSRRATRRPPGSRPETGGRPDDRSRRSRTEPSGDGTDDPG